MKKLAILLALGALLWCGLLYEDSRQLKDGIIRLHVVANSDSEEDQKTKLQVRDAITGALEQAMGKLPDSRAAKAWLEAKLPELERLANDTLAALGCSERAVVSLKKESFPVRKYDTFTLPSGVYESLRVVIGSGEGENWWCVVFPRLCLSATSKDFEAAAAGAGFSEPMASTLAGEQGYELRFFLLDLLGKLENFFHGN